MDNNTESKKEIRKRQQELINGLLEIIDSLHLNMNVVYNRQLKAFYLVFPETEDWDDFTFILFPKRFTMEEFVDILENDLRDERELDDSAIFLYRKLNRSNQRLSEALKVMERYWDMEKRLLAEVKARLETERKG